MTATSSEPVVMPPQSPADASAPSVDRFEAVAASLPSVIGDQAAPQSNTVPGAVDGQPITGEVLQWTPGKVADQFKALFSTLELFRGKHWKVDASQIQSLGELWCPIFQKHVPYTADSEMLQWMFAGGALVGVLKDALTVEVEEFKKSRKTASTAGDSTTVGYPASRGSSASLALERVSPPNA